MQNGVPNCKKKQVAPFAGMWLEIRIPFKMPDFA